MGVGFSYINCGGYNSARRMEADREKVEAIGTMMETFISEMGKMKVDCEKKVNIYSNEYNKLMKQALSARQAGQSQFALHYFKSAQNYKNAMEHFLQINGRIQSLLVESDISSMTRKLVSYAGNATRLISEVMDGRGGEIEYEISEDLKMDNIQTYRERCKEAIAKVAIELSGGIEGPENAKMDDDLVFKELDNIILNGSLEEETAAYSKLAVTDFTTTISLADEEDESLLPAGGDNSKFNMALKRKKTSPTLMSVTN